MTEMITAFVLVAINHAMTQCMSSIDWPYTIIQMMTNIEESHVFSINCVQLTVSMTFLCVLDKDLYVMCLLYDFKSRQLVAYRSMWVIQHIAAILPVMTDCDGAMSIFG